MDEANLIATIDAHERGALAFRIKVIATGARFLVIPHRDPQQPRLWCVVVAKCASGGLVDLSEAGYIAQRHLSRDELADALAAIRANLDAWLSEPLRQPLTEWLLTSPPAPLWDPKTG